MRLPSNTSALTARRFPLGEDQCARVAPAFDGPLVLPRPRVPDRHRRGLVRPRLERQSAPLAANASRDASPALLERVEFLFPGRVFRSGWQSRPGRWPAGCRLVRALGRAESRSLPRSTPGFRCQARLRRLPRKTDAVYRNRAPARQTRARRPPERPHARPRLPSARQENEALVLLGDLEFSLKLSSPCVRARRVAGPRRVRCSRPSRRPSGVNATETRRQSGHARRTDRPSPSTRPTPIADDVADDENRPLGQTAGEASNMRLGLRSGTSNAAARLVPLVTQGPAGHCAGAHSSIPGRFSSPGSNAMNELRPADSVDDFAVMPVLEDPTVEQNDAVTAGVARALDRRARTRSWATIMSGLPQVSVCRFCSLRNVPNSKPRAGGSPRPQEASDCP